MYTPVSPDSGPSTWVVSRDASGHVKNTAVPT
jgi:hypothetical protein